MPRQHRGLSLRLKARLAWHGCSTHNMALNRPSLLQADIGILRSRTAVSSKSFIRSGLMRCQAAMRTLNYSPKLAEGGAEAAPTGSSQGAQSSTAPGSEAFR